MSQTLISVGMPVYNEERYLCETLDSVLAQELGDFELIICDNASTDGTARICKFYSEKDARIRYYRNDHNVGAARNFNEAFRLARGSYFMWVSGHDHLHPKFLSSAARVLDEDETVVLCT